MEKLHGREILDSRGNPTVEVDLTLKTADGKIFLGRGAVPSGASTGSREALELRDQEKNRFLGRGVKRACENVNDKIWKSLQGKMFLNQSEFDRHLIELDGTPNKAALGANAILGVSMAFARAAAGDAPLYRYISQEFRKSSVSEKSFILPVPLINIVNGGAHANNGLDFQEFMIIPVGAKKFSEAFRMGVEVFHRLKQILSDEGLGTTVGDEGGFAPSFDDYENKHEQVLEFIMQAIEKAGYRAGQEIYIGLDVAASEFYESAHYKFENGKRSSAQMIDLYKKLAAEYPILSIEDGLAEQDWDGWKNLTEKLGPTCQLVGDDIFVTNPQILREGIDKKIGNSILIKLNQIGTLTETLDAIAMAQAANYTAVVSHRSGETEDSFIADLAVGTGAGQIKTGSTSRSDRMAKYNQLLRIEEELGSDAKFLGIESFQRS